MKKGLRPTRSQKEAMDTYGLNPANWLVFKKINGELYLVHRETNSTKIIPEQ